MLTLATMVKLWPHGNDKIAGLREGMVASAPAVFAKFDFNSDLVIAQAMAQFSHECGAGTEVIENLNYRAEQLVRQWPSHFTPAQALQMQHKPRLIADQAYNGRMGNRIGTDDGWNFRGRGASQCTGHDGYVRLAKASGLPLLQNPDLVNTPENFLLCAVADFVACGCLPYAVKDDIVSVSGMLNVGHIVRSKDIIGYSQRVAWLKLWKHALGVA